MSNAYSVDLRERAVAYVLNGGQRTTACQIFQIGRDTLYRWLRQYQTEGAFAPKAQGKYASRKLDDAVVAQYIAEHPDATLEELAEVDPTSLVYLDESGVEETLQRPYARAPRGTKITGEVSGAHTHRISLIAALHESRLLAPMRFEGYCDTLVFNAWVEQVLLPELRPGQTVLLDNASFHKSPITKTLIESKG